MTDAWETALWCKRRIRLGAASATVFRSPELDPGDVARVGEIMTDAQLNKLWLCHVASVVERRQKLLWTRTNEPSRPGKLLAFMPSATFVDGVAQAETDGYFDEAETPPWDMWVRYDVSEHEGRSELVCWVPQQFVETVERAVRVHIVDAYRWLT